MTETKRLKIQAIYFLIVGLMLMCAGQMFAELDGHDMAFNFTTFFGLVLLFSSYISYPFKS